MQYCDYNIVFRDFNENITFLSEKYMETIVLGNKSNVKRFNELILISLFAVCCIFSGCKNKENDIKQPEIAVANSYLHAVVKDLCGDRQDVYNLVPPGMCPGHFDISPSQVNRLFNCKIMFIFDFQENIENTVPRIKERGLKVCKIVPPPGLCIPDTYLKIVGQVADALSEENPGKKTHYEMRLKEIENRIGNLSQKILERIKGSGLQNTRVLTSQHQEEFAKWLGLNPVSTFAGRDTVTPAQINDNLKEAEQNQAALVIANKQEGTELAQALAERLNVKLVVFSNFPASDERNDMPAGFDVLLQSNVNELYKAME